MSGKPHTRRHYAVLRTIRELIDLRGISPTLEEIGAAMGIKAKSCVRYYVRKLEDEGLITRDDYKSRTIRLSGTARFMRLPREVKSQRAKPRRKAAFVERKTPKATMNRKKYEADCMERAVALGKARDAEEAKAKRDGVFHDNKSLFQNGTLRASKVG